MSCKRRPGTSRTRLLAVGTVSVAAALLLAACGVASGGSAGDPTATLTLYSGQHQQTTDRLVKEFTRQTGIGVSVRNDDEEVLAQQIVQEGANSPADVFYTENSPALVQLDEHGLLSPVAAATLAAVPARYSAPTGVWVGVTARVSALVYNTDRLTPAELPTSVLDLADPRWAGKLSISPSETDFQPIITSVAARYGQAAAVSWLEAIKRNAGSHVEPDNETLVADVDKGITEIGLVNHYYWYRLGAELGQSKLHSKLAYFAAKDAGYLLDVSGAGVLKSSRHQAESQQLLAFLVSASGQQVIVSSDSFEYPLRPGVPAPAGLTPFAALEPADLSVAQLGDGKAAVTMLQDAGLL
jgi:iron(III) transport system substrate-binding protein